MSELSAWHPDMPMEYRNRIVTGDARELAKRIPDESVDLVFTDPVYDRIEDYRWLAETAARVLVDGGLMVAYYWCTHLPDLILAIGECMRFRWNVFDLKIGTASLDGGQFTRVMTRPALAYSKGRHNGAFWLSDVVYSRPAGRSVNHRWSKNPSATIKWLQMIPGETVYDPFTGGGTVPAVCKMLGRNYVACEIDPDIADLARQRVIDTQPPLFVTLPQQLELSTNE